MPNLVRNKSGLEKVFVDNLEELGDLSARTTITDSTTATFLKCDANGVLETNTNHEKGADDTLTEAQQVALYAKDYTYGNLHVLQCSTGGKLEIDNNVMTTTINKIEEINTKITQGEGNITGGGDGLQQILCYGKDQSGNLDPLNVDNNGHLKITLNDIESGITNSIKTEIQGEDSGATAHTIRTTTDGRIETSLQNKDKQTDQYASQVLAGNTEWGTEIDTTGYSKTTIIVNSNATSNLMILGSSTSGGTFLPFKTLFVVNEATGSATTADIGFIELDAPPAYLKLKNVTSGGVTLDIIVVRTN